MAVAFVQEFKLVDDDRTTAMYDAVSERALATLPIKGLIVHTAGFDEDSGVFRIFDVWETREDADRWIEQTLNPILGELMAGRDEPPTPPDRDSFYELHDVLPPSA
jgi:hypothetical protein